MVFIQISDVIMLLLFRFPCKSEAIYCCIFEVCSSEDEFL